jgi:hypothetical protein
MKISALKNLVDKRILYTYSNYVLFVLTSLFVTVYVMSYDNTYEKSAWLLLLSFSTFLNYADIGFSPVLQRFFSYEISNKNSSLEKSNKLFFFTEYLYLFISFILILLLVLSYFYSYSNLVKVDSSLFILFIIHSIGLIINFYGRKYVNALIGLGYIYEVNYKNTIINTFKLLSVTFLIITNSGLLIIIIAVQSANIVIVITNYFLSKKIFKKKNNLSFKEFKEKFNEIFPTVWRGGLGLFFSTGLIEFSNQFMVNNLNINELNMYMLNLRIVLMISSFSMIYFSSLTPIYVDLRKNSKIQKFRIAVLESSNKVFVIYWVISFLYLIVVKFDYFGFIDVDSNIFFSFILVLVLFLERHHGIHMHIYSTQNKEPWYLFILFSGSIYISLLLLFSPDSAILAILFVGISNLILNNWYPIKMSLQSMNCNFVDYFRSFNKLTFLFIFLSILIIVIR